MQSVFLAPTEVEILVKRKADFFLLKKSDQRKLLFLLRKIAFMEQDFNGKRDWLQKKSKTYFFS